MSAKNKLLASALWYARHGWFVVPLHAPLFANGRLIGCTCEQWQRENVDANYTCRTPGKHPRMNEWEAKATLDPEQITRWWRVWPTANIGIAAGRSGLICLDADTYKDGGGEWDREWGETVTSLTGGGGEHLIYVHPDGEPLGNHQTGLPAWVDVRGHGGQFVAPPSLHPSGKRYEWESGYGPHERQPAPLPEPIADILRQAAQVQPATFSGNGAAVDLGELANKLPALVIALLRNDRSKIDFWLVRSLLRAGLSPDEIRGLWDAYDPTGKYSDKSNHGLDYLARTIANAQDHLNQCAVLPARSEL